MPARFVWYELMTTDPAAAARFYADLLGWAATDSGLADRSYTILSTAEAPLAGLMALPEEAAKAGARPGWMGYLGVDNVDAAAARAAASGGTVCHAPEDIPDVGRFAVVQDPQRAPFALFRGGAAPELAAPTPGTPGSISWHELHATDWETAFAFYSAQFGWTKSRTHDMGEMGTYQLFAIDGVEAGGMLTDPRAGERPFWLFYFQVADIEAAAKRVRAQGGAVDSGPHDVPGGSRILHCRDPQGALFALVAAAAVPSRSG